MTFYLGSVAWSVFVCCVVNALYHVATADEKRPKFTGPISSLTVAVGRDAVLKCGVENLGDYRVAWIHVDKQVLLAIHTHVIIKKEKVSISHENFKTWLLHLKNVQPEDSGYYMCQINTQPMISQVGYLDIVVPPQFLSDHPDRNVSVVENSNVTMSCRATGNPAPKIKWRREGSERFSINGRPVETYDGEELHLVKVSRESMGSYLCIASNGVPPAITRRMYLEVAFPPMIWIPNQLVGGSIGSTISLECHTEAHPRATNLWTRDGYVIAKSSKKYDTFLVSTDYKEDMKLVIKDLEEDDYGVYKCVSKNALGETEGSVNLYKTKIQRPPVRQPTTTIRTIVSTEEEIWAPVVEEQTVEEKKEDFPDEQDNLLQYETEMNLQQGAGSESSFKLDINYLILPIICSVLSQRT